MSETVKVGIVGIGNMGSAHAKSIFSGNIKGMELAAVCDIAESKRLWADENLPHHVSCAFQPNADQELDGFVDKIRRRGDKLSQAAGQRAQGCGRKMHTSGLMNRQKDFKLVCSWSIKSFFEQFA